MISARSYDPIKTVWPGIIAGFATCAVYPILTVVDLPDAVAVTLAASMGPLLGAACWGLREFLTLHRRLTSDLAAASNALAGALASAMFLVQLAVKIRTDDHPSDEGRSDLVGPRCRLGRLHWARAILFAISAWEHPRLGRGFAISGVLIGAALLIPNLAAFPDPPADAGSVDVGPLVGLWYLAVVIAMLRFVGWARLEAGKTAAAMSGSV